MAEIGVWGYIHSDDKKLKIKRYFDERDIDDAHASPFCIAVFGPVFAASWNAACALLYKECEEKGFKQVG